jgi:hypothetical protein
MKRSVLGAFLATAISSPAQLPPGDPLGNPNVSRPGPWDNDVLIFRVATNGSTEKVAMFERAGVPTLARLNDGRLIGRAVRSSGADRD